MRKAVRVIWLNGAWRVLVENASPMVKRYATTKTPVKGWY